MVAKLEVLLSEVHPESNSNFQSSCFSLFTLALPKGLFDLMMYREDLDLVKILHKLMEIR